MSRNIAYLGLCPYEQKTEQKIIDTFVDVHKVTMQAKLLILMRNCEIKGGAN